MELFKVMGSIILDNTDADKKMTDSTKKAEGFATKLGGLVSKAAVVGAGVATGIAAGTTALFGMATESAKATDRIDKLSQRLGLSREGFQEWDYVLGQAGVSIDSMQTGMKTLSQRMGDALEGAGTGAQLFQELGIKITESMSQEEAFDATIIALQNMEDGVKKADLAQQLFGRNGQDLLPLLNGQAGGVEELKNKAHELGLVLSDEAVNSGVLFTDTMDSMKKSLGSVVSKIGVEAMPIIQKLLDWVLENMPTIQAVASNVFDVIGKVVSATGEVIEKYLIPTMEDIWDWVKPYLPQIQRYFQDIFNQVNMALRGFMTVVGQVIAYVKQWFMENQATVNSIKELFFTGMEYIKAVITTAIAILSYIWTEYGDNLMQIAKTAWDYVMSVFKTVIDLITGIYKTFTALLKGDWKGAWEAIQDMTGRFWENLKNVFSKYIDALKSVVKLGLEYMKNIFGNVFEGIKDKVSDIFWGMVDNIKSAFNSIVSRVNKVIGKINNIRIEIPTVEVPLVGTLGGGSIGFPYLPSIPMLAEGGTVQKSGTAIVGEAGAELLELPKGAKVTPLDGQNTVGNNIVMNFYDTKVMSDRDIDILGGRLIKQLRLRGV